MAKQGVVSLMTHNLPQNAQQTSRRARIFLFLRPQRTLLMLLVGIAAVGSVSAQLPGLPVDLPATPAIDQGVETSLAGASASFADGRLDACANAAAGSDLVPVPEMPVDLPVAVPSAEAGGQACAHADANDLTFAMDAKAKGDAAGQHVGMTANADQAGGSAEASTGFLTGAIQWILGLF